MSDTPETDAVSDKAYNFLNDGDIEAVEADFARKLERQRNAAIQSAKALAVNYRTSEAARIAAERERDAAVSALAAFKEDDAKVRHGLFRESTTLQSTTATKS